MNLFLKVEFICVIIQSFYRSELALFCHQIYFNSVHKIHKLTMQTIFLLLLCAFRLLNSKDFRGPTIKLTHTHTYTHSNEFPLRIFKLNAINSRPKWNGFDFFFIIYFVCTLHSHLVSPKIVNFSSANHLKVATSTK